MLSRKKDRAMKEAKTIVEYGKAIDANAMVVPEDTTPSVALSLTDVSRRFGRRVVFSGVCDEARKNQVLVIAGDNGSGKSTLTRIIAGLLAPSAGVADVSLGGQKLDTIQRRRHLGLVAQDLQLYAELSAVENLQFFARLRGIMLDREGLVELLERVGLRGRGRDFVGNYSSGMRQRLKYAFALLHRPPLLLLPQ